jgi:HAE1 family hydrophobic/amphiphilic exporter-1
MSIAEFSVRKPVTIMMLFFGMLFLGMICVGKLPQELLPEISYPQLTVVTTYANAAPEEVETLITKVIEESIATVRNLTRVHSSSKEGISLVTAEFTWDTNMDFAALAMREKIDLIKERLPRDADEPIVKKINPLAKPMMLLSITGRYPIEELLRLTKKFIKDKLEKTEGVASAGISGGREREILIEIDKSKLRGVNIDLLETSKALKNSNLNYPAGSTKEKFYEYLLRTIGEFQNVSEIGDTVISVDDQEQALGDREDTSTQGRQDQEKGKYKRLVLLKDVASITDTFKETESYSRYNGKENISITIQKQPSANSIISVRKVKEQLELLQPSLPKGLNIDIVYDESIFIQQSISGIADDGLQGVMLAFFILLFFLKRFWPALIVSLTIPTGFMFVLICMFFAGVSLNIVSLMGLALSIGGIADAPIVVLENIYRHRSELKEDTVISTIKGTNEVAAAVTGGSLTAMAVFFPMIFLTGVEGQLLTQLAFSVIFCNAASNILCLTLVPKMAAQGKRNQEEKVTRFARFVDAFMGKFNAGYAHVLNTFLRFKWSFIGLTVLLFLFTSSLMGKLDQEMLPKVDKGQFLIEAKLRTGTLIEITNRVVKKIEDIVAKIPELENYTVNVGSDRAKAAEGAETLGSHQGIVIVALKEKPIRQRSTNAVIQEMRDKLEKVDLEGAEINYVSEESLFGSALGGGAAIGIELLGLELAELEKVAYEVESALKHIPGIQGVRNSIPEKAPETKIHINKEKAGLYDLSANDIALTCQMAIKGIVATNFKEEGTEFPIRVRLSGSDTDATSKINDLWIHSSQGIEVPLKEMARLSSGKAPSEIRRLEQRRAVFVYANVFGRKQADVEKDINDALAKLKLPEDYTVRLGGESAERAKSLKALMTTILMSILLIYMLMASQFESLIQPFMIMFSVPFSVIGVSVALYITNTSVNIFSMLGFITLGGMVTNNAIVLFEYINDLRAEGTPLLDAVKQACAVRLRPILMSTLVTLIGLLPLALGLGEGGELKSPLAITVVGGLFVSTTLTLLLIPAFYIIVEGFLEKFRKKEVVETEAETGKASE